MAVIDDVLLFKRVHDTNVSYDSSKISRINKEIMYLLKESVDRNRVLSKK